MVLAENDESGCSVGTDLIRKRESPMVYLYCAGIGAIALLTQFCLRLMLFSKQPGLGHDPVGHKGADLLQEILALARPASAALLLFGLMGLAGLRNEWGQTATVVAGA